MLRKALCSMQELLESLPWGTIKELKELRIDSPMWTDFPPSWSGLTCTARHAETFCQSYAGRLGYEASML